MNPISTTKFQKKVSANNEEKRQDNDYAEANISTHRDILISKINDCLKWAYNQKNKTQEI